MKRLFYTLLLPVILFLSSCNTDNFFNAGTRLKTITKACKNFTFSTAVDKDEEIEVQEMETVGFDKHSLLLHFSLPVIK